MSRYKTVTASQTVGAFATVMVNLQLYLSETDIFKLKVVPSIGGGTCQISVFKRATGLPADLVYETVDFTGTLVDPVDDDGGGVVFERNEGFVFAYEDLDGTGQLHLQIYNNNAASKTFTITVMHAQEIQGFGHFSRGLMTDFIDPDFWDIVFATTPMGTTVGNALQQIVTTTPLDAPNQGGAAGISSNFRIYPDPLTTRIVIRSKFVDVTIPLLHALDQFQAWGMYLLTMGQMARGIAYATGPLVGIINNIGQVYNPTIDTTDISQIFFSYHEPAISAGTLEFRLTFGASIGAGINWFGLLDFEFNVNGSGWVSLGNYNNGISLYYSTIDGFRIFLGLQSTGQNAGCTAAIAEFEIIEGLVVMGP